MDMYVLFFLPCVLFLCGTLAVVLKAFLDLKRDMCAWVFPPCQLFPRLLVHCCYIVRAPSLRAARWRAAVGVLHLRLDRYPLCALSGGASCPVDFVETDAGIFT